MVRLIAAFFSIIAILYGQDWTLDRLFSRPYIWGTWPSQLAWAKHAHVLGFLWNTEGGAFRDVYVYDADRKKLTRLTDLERMNDPSNETEAERDVHRRDYVPPRGGIASFDLSQDGAKAVFAYRGDLYVESTGGGTLARLTKTKAPESNPQFSPDATKVAFVQGGQIYVLGLNGGTLEQRTDVKAPAKLIGFRWSPDGKYFSYSVEPAPGRTLPLPIYSGRFVAAPPFPRSVAGDVSTAEQWYVIGTSGDDPPRSMDAGRGYDSRPVQWSPDSKYLLLASQSADYKSQEIRVTDVSTGKAKTVFHQVDDRWAEVSDVGWDQASRKIWLTSDQSGFKHLYTVGIDGNGLKQITRGNWEIHSDSFSHNPQWIGDSIYYSSTEAGTAERQLYRVSADGASPPERLSKEEGLHIDWISEDGQSRAELRADMSNPFDLYVDGARVTKSPRAEFYHVPWAGTRFVTYPSMKDRKPVAARLLLPSGYDLARPAAKPWPAIVYIHGAGYATSVLKQWGSYQELRFVFNNFLAQHGYVVLEMDYRGSTNYGRDWRSGVYLNMGGPDLEDVLGGVEYLRGLKNIDMARVGIWGWSYGGFMTAMAMFRAPAAFKAGAAFSGVYDWANYNADYTGERLTTPAENPEAYRRSSPIDFSSKLQNHLLLLHGIADDNVLFQDAVQLTEKLIHESKPFEEAFYPEENHAYARDESFKDAFKRAAGFFDRYVGKNR
jgi:dipeptidyl aminopeptidase/acylaminoacyl peptidase